MRGLAGAGAAATPAATAVGPEAVLKPLLEGRRLVGEHHRELQDGNAFAVGLAGCIRGHCSVSAVEVTACRKTFCLSTPGCNPPMLILLRGVNGRREHVRPVTNERDRRTVRLERFSTKCSKTTAYS